MEITYGFLNDVIDDYFEKEGITKGSAVVLTILACKLNAKLKIIEPQLKADVDAWGEGSEK